MYGEQPMEDSRPNPQGFFSNLKSLLTSPRYVPDIELHFFEASYEHFENTQRSRQERRNYYYDTTSFPQQTTRCIWGQITGRSVPWELNRGRKYTLSYNLYRPDGTLLYHKTEHKLKISLHDCDLSIFTWRTYGIG